jgi:hypothetical protein
VGQTLGITLAAWATTDSALAAGPGRQHWHQRQWCWCRPVLNSACDEAGTCTGHSMGWSATGLHHGSGCRCRAQAGTDAGTGTSTGIPSTAGAQSATGETGRGGWTQTGHGLPAAGGRRAIRK